jgi:hypothetical protein
MPRRCCSLVAVIVAAYGHCGGNVLEECQAQDREGRMVAELCVKVGSRCLGVCMEGL